MSTNPVDSLRESVIDAVWRQWHALGGAANIRTQARAVVDPEALLWMSLFLAEYEPRLIDLVVSWGLVNGEFLSVQRVKNIAADYPNSAHQSMFAFGHLMHDTGKDARWKSMLRSDVSPLEYRKNKTRSVSAKLDSPSALMLRLRALLGLGIRADVIAFLLCDPEAYVSSADIAAAIGYNSVAVRRVLTTMVASGGLSITDGPNEEYSIKHQPLRKILGIPDASLPRWRYCRELFSLSAHTLDRDRTQSNTVSDFVLRTSARRMLDTHRRALVKTGIVPRHQTTGLEQVFPDIITQVTTFIQKNV